MSAQGYNYGPSVLFKLFANEEQLISGSSSSFQLPSELRQLAHTAFKFGLKMALGKLFR